MDPRSLEINTDLGLSFFLARQYDQAIEQFRKSIEMDGSFINGHFFLGWAYEQKGDAERAIAEFQKVVQLSDAAFFRAALGHAYASSGMREEGEGVGVGPRDKARHVRPTIYDHLYGAGRARQAFEYLERLRDASEALVWLKVDRASTRFAQTLDY